MGLLRTLLLGDFGNLLDSNDNRARIEAMRFQQKSTAAGLYRRDAELRKLKKELKAQQVAVQALTSFLISKEIIAEGELDAFLTEVGKQEESKKPASPFNIEKLPTRSTSR